jgi:hypothetical protein
MIFTRTKDVMCWICIANWQLKRQIDWKCFDPCFWNLCTCLFAHMVSLKYETNCMRYDQAGYKICFIYLHCKYETFKQVKKSETDAHFQGSAVVYRGWLYPLRFLLTKFYIWMVDSRSTDLISREHGQKRRLENRNEGLSF